jgi:hypothetical protein
VQASVLSFYTGHLLLAHGKSAYLFLFPLPSVKFAHFCEDFPSAELCPGVPIPSSPSDPNPCSSVVEFLWLRLCRDVFFRGYSNQPELISKTPQVGLSVFL